ncbi:hypothetical protein AX16_004415 [Volvariella volvacea WC 439]|nr:hypothetical protein AX16_004415 [Volvariella volvacea WC 439]
MRACLLSVLSVAIGLFATGVQATTCNTTNPCPAAYPCCSEFGFCGREHFCLGGCNPLASHALDSCKPNPLCQDAEHVFRDNSRILTNSTFFDGNVTAYDWIVEKGNIMNTNSSGGELVLILTEENGGTRISSTRYVHYGSITARLKTGRWAGVVTAFITMSDIKDEIDWEFPGAATTEAQSNFFWQGVIPEQTAGAIHGNLPDTFGNYHDYTIDWQPDQLIFAIDGNVVRTVQASDYNEGGVNRYPNTPSRIQLSLWPAGTGAYPPGTVEWAGGMINWNDPDYQAAGQFYALVQSVTIRCADPQRPGPNMTGYIYSSNTTVNPSVAFTNASTLLNGAGLTRVTFSFQSTTMVVGAILVLMSLM